MSWPRAGDGALQLTVDTTGAVWSAGFLRRPTDGALVATLAPGTPKYWNGFWRDTNGAIAYNVGGAPKTDTSAGRHNGFAFAADESLCTAAADPAPPFLHHGLKFDAVGRVYAVVVA